MPARWRAGVIPSHIYVGVADAIGLYARRYVTEGTDPNQNDQAGE